MWTQVAEVAKQAAYVISGWQYRPCLSILPFQPAQQSNPERARTEPCRSASVLLRPEACL